MAVLSRRLAVAVLCLGIGLAGAAPATGSQRVEEYVLKGAFLFNFARYVRWPEGALPKGEALTICVIGHEDASSSVAESLEGKVAEGRPIQVRQVSQPGSAAGCAVLFVTRASGHSGSEVAAATAGRGILTVGEADGFAERGGIINFVTESSKLRFEVNTDAASRAGFHISSHLMRLARVVGR
jgi:hypothetical protein